MRLDSERGRTDGRSSQERSAIARLNYRQIAHSICVPERAVHINTGLFDSRVRSFLRVRRGHPLRDVR